MLISPEGQVVLSVGGPGGPIPGSAETGYFSPWAGANYPIGGGVYNSLSAYYGYGYNSYINGVAGTSPFFASFLASTGYSGGPISDTDPSTDGYNSSGGFPSILAFDAAAPEALAPLLFDPNIGFSTQFYPGSSGVLSFPSIFGGETGIVPLPRLPSSVGGLPVPIGMQAGVGTAAGYDSALGYDLALGLENFAEGSIAENLRVPEWLNHGVYTFGPETLFMPGTANIGQYEAVQGLSNREDPKGPMIGTFRTRPLPRGIEVPWEWHQENGANQFDYFY